MSDELTSALSALSLTPALITHAAVDSPAAWLEQLTKAAPADGFTATKTLVFKPKAKSKDPAQAPALVMIFAAEATETPSAALAKDLGHKEMRLASEDVLKEALGATKNDGELLSLSSLLLPFLLY